MGTEPDQQPIRTHAAVGGPAPRKATASPGGPGAEHPYRSRSAGSWVQPRRLSSDRQRHLPALTAARLFRRRRLGPAQYSNWYFSPMLLPPESSGVAPGLVLLPVPTVPSSFSPLVMSTCT